ncbi:MAG: FAD-dependent monooxygenase [Candidatus Thiodiazotropha sp. (ex Dulcina madagascariensis)]|nr:FAD-dependent monooxygenase [Candidatus Thiodiazotropha sp. (ex Dulcina madagascariensis)]
MRAPGLIESISLASHTYSSQRIGKIMRTFNTDVMIIGAGPAGSTAAALIQKAGFDCMIIDKAEVSPFCDRREPVASLYGSA